MRYLSTSRVDDVWITDTSRVDDGWITDFITEMSLDAQLIIDFMTEMFTAPVYVANGHYTSVNKTFHATTLNVYQAIKL